MSDLLLVLRSHVLLLHRGPKSFHFLSYPFKGSYI